MAVSGLLGDDEYDDIPFSQERLIEDLREQNAIYRDLLGKALGVDTYQQFRDLQVEIVERLNK